MEMTTKIVDVADNVVGKIELVDRKLEKVEASIKSLIPKEGRHLNKRQEQRGESLGEKRGELRLERASLLDKLRVLAPNITAVIEANDNGS